MRLGIRAVAPVVSAMALLSNLPAAGGIGNWTRGGPFGGPVRAVAVDPVHPETMFAGTDGAGVFKSTDSGVSWNSTSSGLQSMNVYALSIDPRQPEVIYAGTRLGVSRSTDAGASWARSDPGWTSWVYSVAVHPRTSAVYAKVESDGLYKSIDRGATWNRIATGGCCLSSFALDPADPAVIYVASLNEISRSIDGGATWSTATVSSEVGAIAVDPLDHARVYAGAFRSYDAGATWEASPGLAGSHVGSLLVDPFSQGVLYAIDWGLLRRCTDAGQSCDVGTGPGTMRAIVADPASPNRLYAGDYTEGFLGSSDGGATWAPSNQGLLATNIQTVAVDPAAAGTLYAASRNGQLFKSNDGGSAWRAVLSLPRDVIDSIAIDPNDHAIVYSGAASSGVWKTTDAGQLWQGLGGCSMTSLAVDPAASSRLFSDFVCGQTQFSTNGFARSTDAGITWSSGMTWEEGPIAVSPVAPNSVLIGRWRSTNGGDTWAQVAAFSPIAYAADPSTSGVLYSHGGDAGAGQRAGVRRSTDFGSTWSSSSLLDLSTTRMSLEVDRSDPATLYAATASGVLRSSDSGSTWGDFTAGLPLQNLAGNQPPEVRTDTDGKVYAALPGGVWVITPTRSSGFYPLAPCRVLDTRLAEGPLGGPAVAAGSSRDFALAGTCAIPAEAVAVSVNVTAIPLGTGELAITIPGIPGGNGETFPLRAGRTRAKNAIIALNPGGSARITAGNASNGPLDFLLDVNGYFR